MTCLFGPSDNRSMGPQSFRTSDDEMAAMRLRPGIGFALVLLSGCGSRTGLLGSGVEGSTASMAGSGAVGTHAGSGSTSATASGSTPAGGGAGTGTTPDSAADGGTDD